MLVAKSRDGSRQGNVLESRQSVHWRKTEEVYSVLPLFECRLRCSLVHALMSPSSTGESHLAEAGEEEDH